MTLNEYQNLAMGTCLPSSNNFSYMMLNLVGEVGEFASKVAKAIRKDFMRIESNHLCDNFPNPFTEDHEHMTPNDIDTDIYIELQKEAGDILWQLSGLCSVMGWDLDDIAQQNLDKLASRQKRNVIDGNGDNR